MMEMKKDKEWLKEQVYELFQTAFQIGKMEYHEADESVYVINGLINQLEEPEKPVIPEWLHKIFSCERDAIQRKYVDPWIVEEVAKTKSYVDNNLKPKPTLFKDEKQCEYVADNYEMIINAIFNGYEVEKEQKYQVIIRDGEYIRLYLCKHGDNVLIGINDNYIEKCPEATYLTEQEIKDYDKRYWAFAEKVIEDYKQITTSLTEHIIGDKINKILEKE